MIRNCLTAAMQQPQIEVNTRESKVVPDCAYTIKEMFEMVSRGIPIPGSKRALISDEDLGVTEDNFDELDSVAINGYREISDLDYMPNDVPRSKQQMKSDQPKSDQPKPDQPKPDQPKPDDVGS